MSDAPWFAGYEPEIQTFVTTKGLDKLDPTAALGTALKSYYNADKMVRNATEGMVRIPATADDPAFKDIYEKVTGLVPAPTADQYKFDGIKRKDGTDLAEPEAAFIRDIAARHKLAPAVARELAAGLVAREDGLTDAQRNNQEVTKAANQVALRTHWGGKYDELTFAATRVAENLKLPPEVLASMATLDAPKYVQAMEALASLSQQLNEAVILRGGGQVRNAVEGYTPEMAYDELERLKQNLDWGKKALTPGTQEAQTLEKLNTIIARGRVDHQMRWAQR